MSEIPQRHSAGEGHTRADRDLEGVTQLSANGPCCQDPWEAAYARFETPAEEIRKFLKRLHTLEVDRCPRDAEVLEIFCGRGNGLHALNRLGFTRVEGADLSAALLAHYTGPSKCYVCDCRELPFDDRTKDIVIVQGGLHHLQALPDDLVRVLVEVRRVLKENGRLVVVEPWTTPFLSMIHTISGSSIARRLSGKIDALATMIHYERETYEQWLNQPKLILDVLNQYFIPTVCRTEWGKLMYVGRKGANVQPARANRPS